MQYPKDKKYRLVDPELTRYDPMYPVAVLPGQYSAYYKKFTAEELAYLPIGSCIKPGLMKDYKLKLRVNNEQMNPNKEVRPTQPYDLETLRSGDINLDGLKLVNPEEFDSGDEELEEDEYFLEEMEKLKQAAGLWERILEVWGLGSLEKIELDSFLI